MTDESALRERGKQVRRSLTDSIRSTNPKNGAIYGAATNWIYQSTLGASASKLKDRLGLTKSENLRDNLTDTDLVCVMFCEQLAAENITDTGIVDKKALMKIGSITSSARKQCAG